jgi:hypothetical protein
MLRFQPRHSIFLETRFPSSNRGTRGIQFGLDLCVAFAVGQSQNQRRDEYIPRCQSARTRPTRQFIALRLGQLPQSP